MCVRVCVCARARVKRAVVGDGVCGGRWGRWLVGEMTEEGLMLLVFGLMLFCLILWSWILGFGLTWGRLGILC